MSWPSLRASFATRRSAGVLSIVWNGVVENLERPRTLIVPLAHHAAIERELARADRSHEEISVVLIDIDHFKRYNDTFGHPEGDALLRETSQAWARQLRPADLLARVGGEEFAVLLPGCGVPDALHVAERLRISMPRQLTCSLGVAAWDGDASASELFQMADSALYRAKRGGRNRAVVAGYGFAQAA
jgi:diguanylate cyclase (GGDEF)-like protein